MKKSIVLVFLVLIVNNVHSQDVKTAQEVLLKHGLNKDNMVAQDYNAAGFKVYQKGDIKDAIVLFKEAINLDPNHILANYNLACAISLTVSGRPKNEITGELSQIVQYLKHAIELDPSRRRKAVKDNDFNAIRDTMEFRITVAEPNKPIVETKKLKFKDINVFEYDVKVIFTDPGGEELWFSDSAGIFRGAGLFSVTTNQGGFPDYHVNEEAKGNFFQVTWEWAIDALGESGYSGAVKRAIKITKARNN